MKIRNFMQNRFPIKNWLIDSMHTPSWRVHIWICTCVCKFETS